jgi:hypothetical protein
LSRGNLHSSSFVEVIGRDKITLIAKPWSIDILPFLKEGDSYRRGLRRFLGGFLLLTAYIAIHFTG